MSAAADERDRSAFLAVATTIADRICREARWNGRRCTWEVPAAEGPRVVRRETDGFLYQGTSGIARFLLRLHGPVAEPAYLETAQGALEHAVAAEREAATATAGYFCGTAGVAPVCLELARATGDDRWREEATGLCDRIGASLAGTSTTVDRRLDLLTGEAGSLLGLLEVHQTTGDAGALAAAGRLGDLLVARARREPAGVSWDTQRPAVFGNLLGLSHGAAGIALALLELYRHTGERHHFFCAAEGLRYEDGFLRPAGSPWPDLRCQAVAEHLVDGRMAELRKKVAAGTFDPGEPSAMDAWCHGAPGIGLVRERFLAVTGLDSWRASVARAAEATKAILESGEATNFSLCHGICGNAEILDRLAPHLEGGPDRARPVVLAAARRGLEEVHLRGARWFTGFPDGEASVGLMVGEAGVGLFYLRRAFPELPSILLPGPPPAPGGGFDAGEELLSEAAGWWRSLHFPRTSSALRCAGTEPAAVGDPTPDGLVEGLERQVGALAPASQATVRDALALETAAFALLCDRPPFVHSFVRSLLRRRLELLDEPGTRVVLAPSSRLCETAWDWETLDPAAPELAAVARRATLYLIHRVHESYEVRRLSGLAAEMYSLLAGPIGVATLLDRLLERLTAQGLLDSRSGAEAEAVRERLMERLRQAYAAGEIEIAEPFELVPGDVDSATCTRCGECCRIKVSIPGDAVYAEFLREILEEPLRAHYPEIEIRHQDDRDTPHVVVDLGDCRHLRRRVVPAGPEITCGIYERRPEFCARFNCVAWWREQRPVATRRTAADRLIEKVARIRSGNPGGER